MKNNKYVEVVQTNTPLVIAIVDKMSGIHIAQCRLMPYASYLQNAELAENIIAAYEKYYSPPQTESKA